MVKSIFVIAIVFGFLTTAQAQSDVVAIVGKKKITKAEFKKRYNEVKGQTINPPSPALFLEELIRYEMGVQEAKKRKLQDDPFVQEQVKQVLYKQLLEKALSKSVDKIKVTEAEMRKFYRGNPELKTSHILIEIKPGANKKQKEAALKRAKEIYEEVRRSKRPFPELVKLYSDDSLSKATGGDIGYQSKVTLVPTYYSAARRLKVGAMSNIVRTRYGFHIIKLTGKRNYQQANKRQIRTAVFDKKRKDLFDKYFRKLRANYKITVNKKALKKL